MRPIVQAASAVRSVVQLWNQPVYVDVVAYGALAKPVAEYMTQGRRVAVSGRLEYREWRDDSDGFRSKHEIVADNVEFLDAKQKTAQPTEEPASVA